MDKFFKEAFEGFEGIPKELRNASEDICTKYNIKGLADPVYIVNVIGKELDIGTTQTEFNVGNLNKENYVKVGERLQGSFGTNKVTSEGIQNILKKNLG